MELVVSACVVFEADVWFMESDGKVHFKCVNSATTQDTVSTDDVLLSSFLLVMHTKTRQKLANKGGCFSRLIS